jgi:hypothetical protein
LLSFLRRGDETYYPPPPGIAVVFSFFAWGLYLAGVLHLGLGLGLALLRFVVGERERFSGMGRMVVGLLLFISVFFSCLAPVSGRKRSCQGWFFYWGMPLLCFPSFTACVSRLSPL